jgi:hypothetical protein
MLTREDMSSLTNVIRILTSFVKDGKKQRKMLVPLDCGQEDLVHQLRRCMNRRAFERWHHTQLDWAQEQARNEALARLCEEVASALQSAVLKAELLRHHTRHKTPLPRFWSARHLVVSALGDILRAFKAFRAVNEEPDLNAFHIRAMVRRYLMETFHLMFLFENLASSKPQGNFYFRWWEDSLAESHFEDFRFDNAFEYAQLDRPQMENTNLSGALGDLAQMPETCLPHYATHPVVGLNTGPYGAAKYLNRLSRQ